MLSQPYRFHGHGSLSYVFRKGHATRGHLLIVRVARNDRRRLPRVAVIVSKKIAKRAHDRNRIRRRLYELIRLELPRITRAFDITVMVTNGAVGTMEAGALAVEVRRMLTAARITPEGVPAQARDDA